VTGQTNCPASHEVKGEDGHQLPQLQGPGKRKKVFSFFLFPLSICTLLAHPWTATLNMRVPMMSIEATEELKVTEGSPPPSTFGPYCTTMEVGHEDIPVATTAQGHMHASDIFLFSDMSQPPSPDTHPAPHPSKATTSKAWNGHHHCRPYISATIAACQCKH
jgi:hypothetical protein